MRTAAWPCASVASVVGRGALACALIGCTASGDDVRPPDDQLFFPSALAVARVGTGHVLFVANANSELRYDSGTISVIDLTLVESVIAAWVGPDHQKGSCEVDTDRRETLVCDEKMFFNESAGVRIGNFATDIAVQDFSATQPGVMQLRVIVPTRGDPSITWADFDGTRLSCAAGTTAFALCDAEHRLSLVHNDPDGLPILDEPFGVFADAANGFAIVTHLTRGAITLVDAPQGRGAQIADVVTGVFSADPGFDPGATGVTGRAPNTSNDIVYIGSRSENRIQTFTVGRPVNSAIPYLLPGNQFLLDGVGTTGGGSVDTRGMQFSLDGDRLYIVNRRPPSLQIYDTSIGPTGTPRNVPTGASDICREASLVAVLDPGDPGDGERAYVTCFQDGQVYVVDPRGQSQVEDIVTVGRGPYAIAASKELKRVFVSNVLEDTIAVIDVDPASPHRNRVVLRIGEPRAL